MIALPDAFVSCPQLAPGCHQTSVCQASLHPLESMQGCYSSLVRIQRVQQHHGLVPLWVFGPCCSLEVPVTSWSRSLTDSAPHSSLSINSVTGQCSLLCLQKVSLHLPFPTVFRLWSLWPELPSRLHSNRVAGGEMASKPGCPAPKPILASQAVLTAIGVLTAERVG
jgi:hypothetical protein